MHWTDYDTSLWGKLAKIRANIPPDMVLVSQVQFFPRIERGDD